jgi:hypothetical protein
MLSENLGHDQLLVVPAAAKGQLYHGGPTAAAGARPTPTEGKP